MQVIDVMITILELIMSLSIVWALFLLKKKNHKSVGELFWFGLLLNLYGLYKSYSNESWLLIIYIILIALSVFFYFKKPATPK
jgi:hypothetical protein